MGAKLTCACGLKLSPSAIRNTDTTTYKVTKVKKRTHNKRKIRNRLDKSFGDRVLLSSGKKISKTCGSSHCYVEFRCCNNDCRCIYKLRGKSKDEIFHRLKKLDTTKIVERARKNLKGDTA